MEEKKLQNEETTVVRHQEPKKNEKLMSFTKS